MQALIDLCCCWQPNRKIKDNQDNTLESRYWHFSWRMQVCKNICKCWPFLSASVHWLLCGYIRLEGPEDHHLQNSRFRRSRDPAHAYVDLTGGVPLPRVIFRAQIPRSKVYFWQKFLSQGYIFLPKALAKGIFLPKNPKNRHFGAKLSSVFEKFNLTRGYLSWNSWKSRQNGLMNRKCPSTKCSLAKGIRPKIEAAHTRQKFFGVPPQCLPVKYSSLN